MAATETTTTTKTTRLITPIFRASYARVWEAAAQLSGRKARSIVCIFEPDADLGPMKALAERLLKEKWPAQKRSAFRWPFRQGTEDEFDLVKHPEYAGKIIVSLRSYADDIKAYDPQRGEILVSPVKIVGPDKKPILDQSQFYSGCYAVASVSAYVYDTQGNRGVSFGLNHLMKIKDGDPLGRSSDPEKDFEAINVEDYGVDNSVMFDEDLGV